MKKVILFSTIICSLCTILFFGCKKEGTSSTSDKATSKVGKSKSHILSRLAPEKLSVSENGFLIFPSIKDLEDYGDFLSNSTHAEVQKYHESINFTSRGKDKFGESYANEKVTDEQQIDYALDIHGIVEINSVIMKPINDNKFLLTMIPENLNSSSYSRLSNGEYDSETMNQLATNRPKENKIDLFEFIKSTPKGYKETQANSASLERKFWGRSCTSGTTCIPNAVTGDCDPYNWTYCCKYTFWIEHGCAYVD